MGIVTMLPSNAVTNLSTILSQSGALPTIVGIVLIAAATGFVLRSTGRIIDTLFTFLLTLFIAKYGLQAVGIEFDARAFLLELWDGLQTLLQQMQTFW